MDKFWKIYRHEYTRHVLRRRFLVALLSVPLWIGFSIFMGILSVVLITNRAPVGYVDQAGLIQQRELPAANRSRMLPVAFLPFAEETEARSALQNKKIQAYFVLPASYRDTLDMKLVYLEKPSATVMQQIRSLLTFNLLAGQPPAIANRVVDGSTLVIQATAENRQVANRDWLKIVAPLVAGAFLMMSVFTSGGYLMQAVVEEKENRTMEILATSASPGQIMNGKIAALISVGLTQVLAWAALPMLMVILAASYLPMVGSIVFDWRMVLVTLVTAIPTFVLIASLMATVGASVTEAREGQQVTGLLTMPVMIPWMLVSVISGNPGGPIAVIFSLFPLTSSLTILIRMAFATVPVWQLVTSTALLIASAWGALWLSGRVFRAGMLRYGKRLTWKDILSAVSPRRSASPPVSRTATHE